MSPDDQLRIRVHLDVHPCVVAALIAATGGWVLAETGGPFAVLSWLPFLVAAAFLCIPVPELPPPGDDR